MGTKKQCILQNFLIKDTEEGCQIISSIPFTVWELSFVWVTQTSETLKDERGDVHQHNKSVKYTDSGEGAKWVQEQARVKRHGYIYLVHVHFALDKLRPPELQSLVQREADALEEKAVLHAAAVAQVVVFSEGFVQLPHAQREWLGGELIEEEKEEWKAILADILAG